MKPPICRFPVSDLIARPSLDERFVRGLEITRTESRQSVTQRKSFEHRTHLSDFEDQRGIEPGNTHPAARPSDNKRLRLKLPERFPNRDMARAKFLGDMVLHQSRAWHQRSADDPIRQSFSNAVG